MIIDLIVGARPNFIKIAPIIVAINKYKKKGYQISFRLIHTGQHYDYAMSNSFFKELEIPIPDVNFNVRSGSQAEQKAKIMIAYEKFLNEEKPDLTLVVGDVNSTVACSIVAKKNNIKVAHVEGGIRSNDLSMPEEINRILTDSITDFFFTTSRSANNNLLKIGVNINQIYYVGNTMIDTLLRFNSKLRPPLLWSDYNLENGNYLLLTLHRPSNVDNKEIFEKLIKEIVYNSNSIKIIFPIHPRTKLILDKLNLSFENLIVCEPLGYLEFNYLMKYSKAIITDSGGITEEATVFNVPCLTLRENTERPETVEIGTNELVGTSSILIEKAFKRLLSNNWKKGSIPELWDGNTSERIIEELINIFEIELVN